MTREPVCPFPYVYGSPLHLRQILLNIYGNATKYSKISGSIHSRLEYLRQEGAGLSIGSPLPTPASA